MTRPALAALFLVAACGGSNKVNYTVSSDLVAQGTASAPITARLVHDLSLTRGVALRRVDLKALDGGDLSFLQTFELRTQDNQLLASLASPPAAGVTAVSLDSATPVDLLPRLSGDGSLAVTALYTADASAARPLRIFFKLRGAFDGPAAFPAFALIDGSADDDDTLDDPGPPPPDDGSGDPGDDDGGGDDSGGGDLKSPRHPKKLAQKATGPKR
ncbi:MAG TPA: hypothetical protein VH083_12010 [Myxococcales bacterium]|jgi:hypothetical protein|nr:hypothetical protein [Myxococcales bacterium]